MRTAVPSPLILAFLAFAVMQCFFALSGISTRETYFERYQGVWDVMVTVKDTAVEAFEETDRIQGINALESAIIYQKAMAKRIITEEEMSAMNYDVRVNKRKARDVAIEYLKK